ncbi:MAG: sugar transferase [Planctomycetaceae bacterium]|jgi:lipopolysaccharide/colanic/teichoic acid biosynthesis glycosyltransferase|nr:sugar transferase [Planctomycetaceae bacterium]
MSDSLRPNVSPYFRIKWYVDFIITFPFQVIVVLLMLLFMLLVKLTSKGPVIYKQVRCTKDDKQFNMYKIRSMVVDAEAGKGAVWAKGNDPRVTTVGKMMRKLHIDEFPQIWNFWRGEMYIIGPRPERPEFVEKLNKEVPGYQYRTLVLPGMTGYAQINLPPDTGLEDVHKKLVLDLEYIEKASFWFDVRLLIGTGLNFIRFKQFDKSALRLIGVARNPEDSPWAEKVGLMEEHQSLYLTPKDIKPET